MSAHATYGYSSAVAINLEFDGLSLPVAQIGPNSLILREPSDIPPSTRAVLVINIDGRIEREEIVLTNGSTKSTVVVSYF